MRSLLAVTMLALFACSDGRASGDRAAGTDASTTTMSSGSGGGAVPGSGGAHAPSGGQAQRDAAVACTEGASPDDEFSRACPDSGPIDAGASDAGTMHAPPAGSDASIVRLPDAAIPFDAGHDAGEPPVGDEGLCAQRDDRCELGHAATTVGTASC